MKINVQFSVDDVGTVDARDVGRLIAEHEILAFERSSGWVKIGVDPLRGDGGKPYDGPERRNIIQKRFHRSDIRCHYCLMPDRGAEFPRESSAEPTRPAAPDPVSHSNSIR